MNKISMSEDELLFVVKFLIDNFRNTAHHSLLRIGRSLGVTCAEGHYDKIRSAVRGALRGVILDEEGSLRYWFHGVGCEIILEDVDRHLQIDVAHETGFTLFHSRHSIKERALHLYLLCHMLNVKSKVLDFNIYPKRDGVSIVIIGGFGFKKYLSSVNIEVDDAIVMKILEEAACSGWIEPVDGWVLHAKPGNKMLVAVYPRHTYGIRLLLDAEPMKTIICRYYLIDAKIA